MGTHHSEQDREKLEAERETLKAQIALNKELTDKAYKLLAMGAPADEFEREMAAWLEQARSVLGVTEDDLGIIKDNNPLRRCP